MAGMEGLALAVGEQHEPYCKLPTSLRKISRGF